PRPNSKNENPPRVATKGESKIKLAMSRAAAKKTKTPPGGRALDRVKRGERIVLRRGKKAVAAVIPIQDLKLFKRLLRQEEDRLDVQAALEALKEPGSIPLEQAKAELGL